ncbi:MAG: hypothetical protein ACK48K_10875, partial [Planctomycetota bacterium]
MKNSENGLENISEEHALAAAILADLPYVVAAPIKPKKEKKKKIKAPEALSETAPSTAEEPAGSPSPQVQHPAETTRVNPTNETPAPSQVEQTEEKSEDEVQLE